MRLKGLGILIFGLLVTLLVSAGVYGAASPEGSALDVDGNPAGASTAAPAETTATPELLTITGGKMLIDRYHGGDIVAGGFIDYLVTTGGWTVDVTTTGPFTVDILAHYDIVMIPTTILSTVGIAAFTSLEVSAVNTYVRNGGGLWLTHEYSNYLGINSVASQFGVTFSRFTVEDPVNNAGTVSDPIISEFAVHPITKGITSYAQYAGVSLNVTAPAYVVASGDITAHNGEWSKYPPVLAAAEIGFGRVVFEADQSIFDPTLYLNYDNLKLLSNIVDWLAAPVDEVCGIPLGTFAAGWTLMGWASNTPGHPATIAAGLEGTARIYGYNPAVPANQWEIYDSSAPAFVNTLAEINKWSGYWVYYEPAAVTPPSGVVGWWPGDGNTNDISGVNHGVLTGGATVTGGMVGQAFSFNGTGAVVNVAHDPTLNLSNFTLEAWVNPGRFTPSDWQPLITKEISPRPPSLWLYEDTVEVWIGSGNAVAGGNAGLALNSWNHVVATYDGSDVKIYIDGALDVSAPYVDTIPTNTNPFSFGAAFESGTGYFFQGLMDEVTIYNRALTLVEVNGIYRAGSLGKIKPQAVVPPAGLVGWWPGDGNANDIEGVNNGVLTGDATSTADGMVGQAFSFNGTDAFVNVAHNPTLNLSNFTLEAWVNPGQILELDWQPLIAKEIEPTPPSLWLYGNIVEVWVGPVDQPAAASNTGLALNSWHHLVATYDASNVKIYIDGALDVSAPYTATTPTNTNPFTFGAAFEGGSVSFFQGLMDEVSIYNRALTAGEVKGIYDAGSLGKIKP